MADTFAFSADIHEIIRVNRILDPNDIKQGSELFIPGARVTFAFSKELLRNSGIPVEFARPCRQSRISSKFGYRKDPFTGRRAFHNGLDLSPGYGASVYASMDGVVTYAGWMGGYGKLVVIKHRRNYSTRYGHLSRVLVRKGARIDVEVRSGHARQFRPEWKQHQAFTIDDFASPLQP